MFVSITAAARRSDSTNSAEDAPRKNSATLKISPTCTSVQSPAAPVSALRSPLIRRLSGLLNTE